MGGGRRVLFRNLALGGALRIYRVAAPGYSYYNDPNFKESDTGYAVDVGLLYRSEKWTAGTSNCIASVSKKSRYFA